MSNNSCEHKKFQNFIPRIRKMYYSFYKNNLNIVSFFFVVKASYTKNLDTLYNIRFFFVQNQTNIPLV